MLPMSQKKVNMWFAGIRLQPLSVSAEELADVTLVRVELKWANL